MSVNVGDCTKKKKNTVGDLRLILSQIQNRVSKNLFLSLEYVCAFRVYVKAHGQGAFILKWGIHFDTFELEIAPVTAVNLTQGLTCGRFVILSF